MRRSIINLSCVLSLCSSLAAATNPTFTFGPSSNYKQTGSISSTPTGNNLLITPTDVSKGIPPGGIDVIFGPGQQASMKTALAGVCAKGATQDCLNTLANIMDTQQTYAIQARVVGIDDLIGLSGLAVLLLAMGIYQQFNSPQPVPAIHLPSSDIVQLQSQTSAPYTFITKSGSPPVTFSSVQTPTVTVSSATISTLSASVSGHQSGDIIVSLPTQPAQLMMQLFEQVGGNARCANGTISRKRQNSNGINLQGISNAAAFVLPMAAPGQLLNGLGLQAQQALPQLRDTIDQTSMAALQGAAAGLAVFKGVAQGLIDVIAETVWLAAYEVCANNVADLSEIVLEEWLFDDPQPDKNCPSDPMKMPSCANSACAGNSTGDNSPKCSLGDKNGCPCLPSVTPLWEYGNQSIWDAGQQVLIEMLSNATTSSATTSSSTSSSAISSASATPTVGTQVNGGTLICGTANDMGDANNYVDLTMINNAANYFCQQQVNAGLVLKPGAVPIPQISINYNDHMLDPVYVSLTWADNPSCPTMDFTQPNALATCNSLFGIPINDCDTYNPNGYYWWKQGGTYDLNCITWEIKRDTIAPFSHMPPLTSSPDWRPGSITCHSNSDCVMPQVPDTCITEGDGTDTVRIG